LDRSQTCSEPIKCRNARPIFLKIRHIKPFGRNILIKPAERKQVLVADTGSLCEYGEVIAVGDKVETIQVGQKLGFVVWGIQKLDVDGAIYYFIPETSEYILGFIEDEL